MQYNTGGEYAVSCGNRCGNINRNFKAIYAFLGYI